MLCADSHAEAILQEVFRRSKEIGVDMERPNIHRRGGETDGWVRKYGVGTLRTQRHVYSHGLLIFDHQGCGDRRSGPEIEAELDDQLAANWGDQAKAIVIEPEVEAWLWGMTESLHAIPKLSGADLNQWLRSRHPWPKKPVDPKDHLQALFRDYRAKYCGDNFRLVAQQASLNDQHCLCRSYRRFVSILRTWFPL